MKLIYFEPQPEMMKPLFKNIYPTTNYLNATTKTLIFSCISFYLSALFWSRLLSLMRLVEISVLELCAFSDTTEQDGYWLLSSEPQKNTFGKCSTELLWDQNGERNLIHLMNERSMLVTRQDLNINDVILCWAATR